MHAGLGVAGAVRADEREQRLKPAPPICQASLRPSGGIDDSPKMVREASRLV